MAIVRPQDVDSYRMPEAGFGDPRGRVPYDVLRAAAWGTDYNGQRNAITQALVGAPAPAPAPVGGMTPEQRYLQAIGWQGTEQQFYQSRGLLLGGTPLPQVAAQASGAVAPATAIAPQAVAMGMPPNAPVALGTSGFGAPLATGQWTMPAPGFANLTPEQMYQLGIIGSTSDSPMSSGGTAGSAAGTGGPGGDTG